MPDFLRAYLADQSRAAEEKNGSPIRFAAATAGVKRDGIDLAELPWSFDNYRRNPVFLWVHDYTGRTLPLGRAEIVEGGERGAFAADVLFDQDDEFAMRVESKYRRGFLNTVSVGWDDVDGQGVPARVSRQKPMAHDLLDISAVPVPGDPGALAERQMRALAALRTDIDEVMGEGETISLAQWERTAVEMAELFVPKLVREMDEKERERQYHRLCGVYRKANRTPPELLPQERVTLLSPVEVRGLFFENETRLVPDLLIPDGLGEAEVRAIVRAEMETYQKGRVEERIVKQLHQAFMEGTS